MLLFCGGSLGEVLAVWWVEGLVRWLVLLPPVPFSPAMAARVGSPVFRPSFLSHISVFCALVVWWCACQVGWFVLLLWANSKPDSGHQQLIWPLESHQKNFSFSVSEVRFSSLCGVHLLWLLSLVIPAFIGVYEDVPVMRIEQWSLKDNFVWGLIGVYEDVPVLSFIDCFLFFIEWKGHFLEVRQGILPKITSDHFLVLWLGTTHTAKRPFKFENIWLEVDDFCDFVKAVWDDFNSFGSSSFILAKKLIFLHV